jgi:hypothetical protein
MAALLYVAASALALTRTAADCAFKQ